MAIGSIFEYIGKSLWFIGNGQLLFNGSALASINASTTLQFLLYNSPTASPVYDTGTVYTAGLARPSDPTIAVGSGSTKLMTGTFSVRITAIRSLTGAESNASNQSNVITCAGNKVSVTFPAAVGNGHDLWGVYVTAANFGTKGPHFSLPTTLTGESPAGFVKESTVAGAGRTLSFEWGDGDLTGQNLAPLDNYPPPAGVFAFTLEGCMAVVGCYAGQNAVSDQNRGSMVAVSKAGFPEAFPVDADHLIALPEAPTLVLPRAAGGFVYIAGKNSLSVVRYTGATTKAPLSLSLLWPDIGFSYPWNACLAEGQLYGYVGHRGLVRIGSDGMADTEFSMPVQSDFDGIDDSGVVVGFDPATNHVVYGFTTVDNKIRLFCYNKSYSIWSTPIKSEDFTAPLTNVVLKGMYTFDGHLYLIVKTIGVDAWEVYQFNVGNGSKWRLRSAWRDGGHPEKNKTITKANEATSNNSTNPLYIRIYKNLSDVISAVKSYVPAATPEHLRVMRTNVLNAKTYSLEMAGEDDDSIGLEVTCEGVVSDVNF
jgi:hypothetical protein